MTLPTSIPSWRKIVDFLSTKGITLNLNVDPFNGKHGGTLFFRDVTYSFKIEVFPKNMILSLKEYVPEIIECFSGAFEIKPSITYEVIDDNSVFKCHTEWYFRCEEEEIVSEINKLKASPDIKVLG